MAWLSTSATQLHEGRGVLHGGKQEGEALAAGVGAGRRHTQRRRGRGGATAGCARPRQRAGRAVLETGAWLTAARAYVTSARPGPARTAACGSAALGAPRPASRPRPPLPVARSCATASGRMRPSGTGGGAARTTSTREQRGPLRRREPTGTARWMSRPSRARRRQQRGPRRRRR
eukprot:scaffold19606_cov84-Isochrysis_galbana.AAC.4